MRLANSFLLREADATAVPAGHALAVDRVAFSARVAQLLESNPNINIHREEVTHLDEQDPETLTILASGPLTSAPLAAELQRLTGANHLAFYDSISPIVDATTIDMDRVFFAARYGKGTADYINCPFTKEEYDRFLEALTTAEAIEQKPWEKLPEDADPTRQSCHPSATREDLRFCVPQQLTIAASPYSLVPSPCSTINTCSLPS
jgi:methylenetetrahydrofolate--tRNA-(uracil-5-)-methyltransferase